MRHQHEVTSFVPVVVQRVVIDVAEYCPRPNTICRVFCVDVLAQTVHLYLRVILAGLQHHIPVTHLISINVPPSLPSLYHYCTCTTTVHLYRLPGFNLHRRQWSLLNRFRTGQPQATAMRAARNGVSLTMNYVTVVKPKQCHISSTFVH